MLHSQACDGADLRIKIGARNNANCWSSFFSKSVACIQRAAGKHAAAQPTNTRCHCAGPLFLHGFTRTTSWSKKLVRCRSAGHKAGVSDGSMNGPKGDVRVESALADDGLVHCQNEQEAQALKAELQAGLAKCRLEVIRRKPRSCPHSPRGRLRVPDRLRRPRWRNRQL
jgi:hypothetical protein